MIFRLLAGALALSAFAAGESAAPRRYATQDRVIRRTEYPSSECPQEIPGLSATARQAVSAALGQDAEILCAGDLNGNGRPEVLGALVNGTFGKELGFYRVVSSGVLLEQGADEDAPWKLLLRISDTVDNGTGRIGWKQPVGDTGIGLRSTMSDQGRICLQLRRLDAARDQLEEPLVIVRWDRALASYTAGACAQGTSGTAREVEIRIAR